MQESIPALTPTDLFTPPGLRPSLPSQYKFSPCGRYVSYLKGSETAPTTLDLWCFDREQKVHTPVAMAQQLDAQADENVTELSDAERAERERKRQFTFGITHYQWVGKLRSLALYADGQAYIKQDIDDEAMIQITPGEERHSGFNPSPSGGLISYVRGGNLFYQDIQKAGSEVQVSHDANECVSYGLPDFLAAEEMHRFAGAWWSECERYLIYCRNDDAPVRVSHRIEIDGNGSRTIAQRYPFAGEANPDVSLHLHDTLSGHSQKIWQNGSATHDTYLARVLPIADGLCLLTQDRLQQRLVLSAYEFTTGNWQELYRETSATWINLTDDLQQLLGADLLFSSEDQGQRQAIVIGRKNGIRRLQGPSHINQIHCSDENFAYVSGWDASPIDNHLFWVALDGSGYGQLTHEDGVHEVIVNRNQKLFIDRFCSPNLPAKISINALNVDVAGVIATPSDHPVHHILYEEVISEDHRYAQFAANHVTPHFGVVEADGQALHYRLTPPATPQGKHPTIVYVYGGPGAQKVRRDWGTLLVQMFAQQGYGVLELDNRGSTNRGRLFEAGLYKRMGSIEIADQVLGLSVLTHEPWADLERVGVFGHSYGGYMSLMCLCQAGKHFKAGVAVAPVADWQLYDSHYTERFMGLPDKDAEAYAASSVIPHLPKLERPLLLMHGMADDNVLFTHSTMLMSELQQLGKPFELMTYPGAKHSMQETHVSIHRFDTILDFFNRTL
ncbi:MAG: prolyl oligopeptidase family serine peptidase [Pseudomonadota bacterium]|nr:prolyl oligopeptidase family serine peptidase [Pseudomonadota bacterium]